MQRRSLNTGFAYLVGQCTSEGLDYQAIEGPDEQHREDRSLRDMRIRLLEHRCEQGKVATLSPRAREGVLSGNVGWNRTCGT